MDLDTITRQCPYGDLQLTYHEVGQKSSYPTIILIHGTGGNTDKHFSHIFPMLGIHQRFYRLICILQIKPIWQ